MGEKSKRSAFMQSKQEKTTLCHYFKWEQKVKAHSSLKKYVADTFGSTRYLTYSIMVVGLLV